MCLSATVADCDESPTRATVVALPGGGYTRAYWHNSLLPGQSLLDLGSRLGFKVIALDRPGYGASADLDPARLSWDAQTKILLELIDALPSLVDLGAGVFLIGHSLGGCLSLLMAAQRSCKTLLGVDVSGVPYRFHPDLTTAVEATIRDVDSHTKPSFDRGVALFYGPPETHDPRIPDHEQDWTYLGSSAELKDSFNWPDRYAEVVGRIEIPVQVTLGEFERVTRNDWDGLYEMGALFAASPRVVLQRQLAAGHNISLHHVGRAYHLRALTFFEECLALPPQ